MRGSFALGMVESFPQHERKSNLLLLCVVRKNEEIKSNLSESKLAGSSQFESQVGTFPRCSEKCFALFFSDVNFYFYVKTRMLLRSLLLLFVVS